MLYDTNACRNTSSIIQSYHTVSLLKVKKKREPTLSDLASKASTISQLSDRKKIRLCVTVYRMFLVVYLLLLLKGEQRNFWRNIRKLTIIILCVKHVSDTVLIVKLPLLLISKVFISVFVFVLFCFSFSYCLLSTTRGEIKMYIKQRSNSA